MKRFFRILFGNLADILEKKEARAVAIGTVARGLMWAIAAISAKYGWETMSNDHVTAFASWAVTGFSVTLSLWWSQTKNQKLVETGAKLSENVKPMQEVK